jgi:hypothetical protein
MKATEEATTAIEVEATKAEAASAMHSGGGRGGGGVTEETTAATIQVEATQEEKTASIQVPL